MNELPSLLLVKVTIMALKATATSSATSVLRMNVARIIGMTNELIISKLPCKGGISELTFLRLTSK